MLPLARSLTQGVPVLVTGACGNTEYWLRDNLANLHPGQANVLRSVTGHPDIVVLDARTTDTETVREIRSSLLNYPASLDHRYLVVKHIEALHRAASASLLKTLEEPLDHVRIVLTSRVPRLVLPTITSRVLTVSMPQFSPEIISQVLTSWGLDDVDKRSSCCSGDLGIARELDIEVLTSWDQEWAKWILGTRPDVRVFYHWTKILPDQNLETLSSCCSGLLVSIAVKMWGSRYWGQVGEITLGIKNKVVRKTIAKQELSSRLFDLYALVKTANLRNA